MMASVTRFVPAFVVRTIGEPLFFELQPSASRNHGHVDHAEKLKQ
jgi:hypothetical protein